MGREGRVDVLGALALHGRVGGDGAAEGGGWRVDGGEGEDVQQEEAVVVEEVADAFSREGGVGVGEGGDARGGVYAVEVGRDALHC